jgi:FkbM family methyltransferase
LPIQKGIGDKKCLATLKYSIVNSELASFCDEINQISWVGETNDRAVDVEIVTLDSFLQNFDLASSGFDLATVGLVKIDVEGFEVEVLRGAHLFLEQCGPELIQIEFNHHQLFRGHTLFSMASMLPHYNVFRLVPFGSGLAEVDPAAIDSNIFCFSNFVFIRSDISNQILTTSP